MKLRNGKCLGGADATFDNLVTHDGQGPHYSYASFADWVLNAVARATTKAYLQTTPTRKSEVFAYELALIHEIFREHCHEFSATHELPAFTVMMIVNNFIGDALGVPHTVHWRNPLHEYLRGVMEEKSYLVKECHADPTLCHGLKWDFRVQST